MVIDMDELIEYIKKFNQERDWEQFHTPNNLAKSIVLEANELLEHFQFDKDNFDKKEVCEELADVMTYCIDMAYQLGVDPIEIIYDKMKKNAEKYPADKVKGSSKKYNEY